MPRLLQRLRADEGMTLVEVVIAGVISAVAFAVFAAALTSVQQSVNRQTAWAMANDQARLAVEQLDREVRSGSLLYDPGAESPAYYSARIYTPHASANRCVQWRIESDGRLRRRAWPGSFGAVPDASTVTPWRTVAENVINRNVNRPAFTRVGSGAVRTLQIRLMVNPRPHAHPEGTVEVRQSVTGRNTRGPADQAACAPAPAG